VLLLRRVLLVLLLLTPTLMLSRCLPPWCLCVWLWLWLWLCVCEAGSGFSRTRRTALLLRTAATAAVAGGAPTVSLEGVWQGGGGDAVLSTELLNQPTQAPRNRSLPHTKGICRLSDAVFERWIIGASIAPSQHAHSQILSQRGARGQRWVAAAAPVLPRGGRPPPGTQQR
jgi:hypothetical protein